MHDGDQRERAERRTATVLFCDLGGYTAWNEQTEPEDVALVMDRIKRQAARTFESFGGVANQFVGDEIIGLFGVTQAHEDDPRRAVAAALALHALVRELPAAHGRNSVPDLRMHSGIETGTVYARNHDLRSGLWEITGDTVNVAARLRSLAGADEILIGPATQTVVAPFFATEALPTTQVRGRHKPIAPYRVLAPTASSRFDASERRGLTKYVGRTEHLERLLAAFQEARNGHGRLVTLEGPPGIGKTRLLHELRRRVATEATPSALRVLHGRCHDFGNVPPYQPFVEALREVDLASCELNPATRDALSALLVPAHLPLRFREASGEHLRDAITAAVFELLFALAKRAPLLIVFEDWQLADEPSRVALRHLAQGIGGLHVMIAVNYRSGEIGASLRTLSSLHLELTPFDELKTAAIAEGVLQAQVLPSGLAAHIYQHSLGNPFFAEEVARSLLDSGALARLPGSLVLVKPLAQLQTPQSVQAIVRARVDRLPREQRDVLRAASVVGVECARDLLERLLRLQHATEPAREATLAATPQGGASLVALLEELESQGLLYRSSSAEGHHRFRHAITQEVVYESLPLYERRALHDLVARSIEQAQQERGEELACEVLAHHYGRSLNAAKALHYAELAGDKAWRAFALQQADAHYRRALELVDASGCDDAAQKRLALSVRWAKVGVYNPHPDQVLALRSARAAAQQTQDLHGACLCLNWQSWLEYALGNQPSALTSSLEFLELARQLQEPALEAQALTNAGLCHSVATEYEKATEYIEAGIVKRGRFAGTAYAYALGTLAMLHGDQGRFERAFDLAQRAVTIADQSGRLTLQGPMLTQRGMVEAFGGAFEACANTGAAVHDIAEHIDGNYLRAMGRSLEGYATFMLSRDMAAIDLQRQGVTLLERHGIYLHLSWSLALLAETLVTAGLLDEANDAAEAALRRAAEGDRLGEANALRVRMYIRGAQGAALSAVELDYERALQVADAKQSPRERALTELQFGQLLRARGEITRAAALRETALRTLTSIGFRASALIAH